MAYINKKQSGERRSGGKPNRRQSSPPRNNRQRFGGSNNFRTQNPTTQKMGAAQVEGRRAVLELLIAGTRKIHEIYLLEDLKPAPILEDIETIAASEGVHINKISKTKFFQIAHTDTPQGIIARAAPLKPQSLEELINNKGNANPFLLIVDGVVDTANLGSLMRSAECAGVTGIVLGKHRSASITAATTKSAAGAIEYLPIALVSSIPQTLEKLKEKNVWTVGLDQNSETQIYDINFANEAIAMVVGAESSGLKSLTKKRLDALASIPLQGKINSLNASVASAIGCFEIQRLRSQQANN